MKVAILDYLKRYHPADTDTLTMVSLHYTLYRQIAQALEERAQGLLNSLTAKTLGTPVEAVKSMSIHPPMTVVAVADFVSTSSSVTLAHPFQSSVPTLLFFHISFKVSLFNVSQ